MQNLRGIKDSGAFEINSNLHSVFNSIFTGEKKDGEKNIETKMKYIASVRLQIIPYAILPAILSPHFHSIKENKYRTIKPIRISQK